MRSWTRWSVAAAAAVVLTVPGCAGDPEPRPADGPATGSAVDTTRGSPDDTRRSPDEAVSVRVVVSGGITGATTSYEVSHDDRPPGMTRAAADRVLRLAGSDAVTGFAGTRSSGPAPCCDQRMVEITVEYADGTRSRIRTPETGPAPPEVRRLLALLAGTT